MNRNIAMTVALLTAIFTVGCSTTLEEGGAYQGDELLYNADKTITSTYRVLRTFVKWEYDNRDVLPVEVSRAADAIRDKAELWLTSAGNLRDAYAANPTSETGSALTAAIDVLQTALNEAIKYMAANQKEIQQ